VGSGIVRSVLPVMSISSTKTVEAALDNVGNVGDPMRTTMNAVTQAPAPSQALPPVCLQGVPAGELGKEATPATHVSAVQALPSDCASRSSFTVTMLPLPSHTLARQSPATCAAIGVPCGAKF